MHESEGRMTLISPLSFDVDTLFSLLRDVDGNVRSALLCWSVAIAALIILRIPRQVVLSCLVVAATTVGLASLVTNAAQSTAAAASSAEVGRSLSGDHEVPARSSPLN